MTIVFLDIKINLLHRQDYFIANKIKILQIKIEDLKRRKEKER
jgi:hypothetical protein